MSKSEFAKSQLEKFGWQTGQGLGKEKQGNHNPIKVTRKLTNSGIGHQGEQFEFAWWDHVYNKAASNINVETNGDTTNFKSKRALTKESIISTKKPKTTLKTTAIVVSPSTALLYSSFVRSSTDILAEKASKTSPQLEDDSADYSSKLNDKDLLKACGGRCGHRGTDFKGKLKRLKKDQIKHTKKLEKSKKRSKSDKGLGSSTKRKKKHRSTDRPSS